MGLLDSSFFRKGKVGPKTFMASALIFLALLNMYMAGNFTQGLTQLAVSVLTAVIVEEAACVVTGKEMIFPSSAFITGMLVGGILSIGVPFYIIALTAAVAIVSKKILVYNYSHVFNPANFGLLFAGLALSTYGGWWISGNPSQLMLLGVPLLVVAVGLLVSWKAKRLYVALTGIAVQLLLFAATGFPTGQSLAFVLSSIGYFYLLFMAVEPMTSPFVKNQMIAYGVLAGALPVLLARGSPLLLLNAYPLGLFIANAFVPVLGKLLPE